MRVTIHIDDDEEMLHGETVADELDGDEYPDLSEHGAAIQHVADVVRELHEVGHLGDEEAMRAADALAFVVRLLADGLTVH